MLINYALNAIPLYYLSFYKILNLVMAEMVKVQREFLWGGCVEKRIIPWVNWEEVCKGKDVGGLGVRSIGLFNESLLNKWRWCFLIEKEAI